MSLCLYVPFPLPSLPHRRWQTYFLSHGWSRQPVVSFPTLAFNTKIHPTPTTLCFQENSLSLRLLRHPPPPLPSLPLPLFFIPPSPASHLSLSPSLSLSFSPHLSPPLLRVSGRLFFLCLLLMKGRTKLPSLCPCVVGKFTSLFVSFFSFHPSVAASVLHVSSKSASRSGRLRGGLYLHLCILH